MLALSKTVRRSIEIEAAPAIGASRPLTAMKPGETYHGQDGGLYGQNSNRPPRSHLAAALREGKLVRPLRADGEPDERGLIGFLAIGFSNTFHEFREFVDLARRDGRASPSVRAVNGAQLHIGSGDWAASHDSSGRAHPDPWNVLDERLEHSGVTEPQVQAAWIKLTSREPGTLGAFPLHAQQLTRDLRAIVRLLKCRFPNLRLAFLSSRIFAGYARTPLSPEPYAYESAFSVRWLIQEQIGGSEGLNYDPARGAVSSPLLLWGPYLWALINRGKKNRDLGWTRGDFAEDGTHPSAAGARKVARRLLTFMKTNAVARPWFTSVMACILCS